MIIHYREYFVKQLNIYSLSLTLNYLNFNTSSFFLFFKPSNPSKASKSSLFVMLFTICFYLTT